MRRSSLVKLTVLPLLASAAMARAEPPGLTDPVLSPPGLTEPQPTCSDTDPNLPDCPRSGHTHVFSGSVRGGFGGYFGAGGGG